MMDLTNIPTTSKIILDVLADASKIEHRLESYLLPPMEGIYSFDQSIPIATPGTVLYTRKKNSGLYVLTPIVDFAGTQEAAYNEDGKMIVCSKYMIDKDRYLSNIPFIPYRGINILKAAINDQINSVLRYRKYREDFWMKLKPFITNVNVEVKDSNDHIDPIATRIAENKLIDDIIFSIDQVSMRWSSDISKFIGSDDWHLYSVGIGKNTIEICKFIDYRIFQWSQEHGEEFR
jgi:hypothetical protein